MLRVFCNLLLPIQNFKNHLKGLWFPAPKECLILHQGQAAAQGTGHSYLRNRGGNLVEVELLWPKMICQLLRAKEKSTGNGWAVSWQIWPRENKRIWLERKEFSTVFTLKSLFSMNRRDMKAELQVLPDQLECLGSALKQVPMKINRRPSPPKPTFPQDSDGKSALGPSRGRNVVRKGNGKWLIPEITGTDSHWS